LISLVVIAALAFGLVHFSKWWQKRHGRNIETNRIRVLTQHHLGPKKSLSIIRVAGETILIGVTDANISMIKTLSLLEDEDVPTMVPNNFAGEMKKQGAEDQESETDEDISAFAQIRDRISTRIKEMRPL
jgi:flagellar protein FliO/FliZ